MVVGVLPNIEAEVVGLLPKTEFVDETVVGCPNIDVWGAFAEPKIDCDGFTVLSTLEIFANIDVVEDAVVLSPKAGPCELDMKTD